MLQGLKNFGQAATNAAKLKSQQAKMQKMLAEIEEMGTDDQEHVKVWMNGNQEIVRMEVSPKLISFVNDNFFSVDTKDQAEKEELNEKGQKFFSAPFMKAIKNATEKVQKAIVKKMTENGGIGDLMSMLQAAGGSQ
jgi:DNA-binding protein YbaB